MGVDVKDKKLLCALELNARASFSEIGKSVGLSKETAANRVKMLERKGIISGFNCILNIAKLGYTGYAVFVRLERVDEKMRAALMRDLQENPVVYWIASLGGNYDLLFAIQAKNIVEFNHALAEIQEKYPNAMTDITISIRAQVYQYRRKYLLQKTDRGNFFFGDVPIEVPIDDADRIILNTLSADARKSIVDIAHETGIVRTTAHHRIKQLEEKGIIQAYSVLIHPEAYGYHVYQLMITTSMMNETIRKRFRMFSAEHPNITFLVDSVGRWNLEITCEVASQGELQALLTQLRSAFHDVITGIEIILTFNYYVKYKPYAGDVRGASHTTKKLNNAR